MLTLRVLFAFLLATLPVSVSAQVPGGLVPPGMPPGSPAEGATFFTPMIGGISVSCVTNQQNGSLPVVFVAEYNLNDSGHALDPQFGGIPPQIVVPPRILINPALLLRAPSLAVQRFVGGHECAHHFLPNQLRMVEANADCWSIKTGRKQGWFTSSDMGALAAAFIGNYGDWTHAPGPVRVAHMNACFSDTDDGTVTQFVP